MPRRASSRALLGALVTWVACTRPAPPATPPPPTNDAAFGAATPQGSPLKDTEACSGCELAHGHCDRGVPCGDNANSGHVEICAQACEPACCAALPEKYPPPRACGECERQGERCVCGHRCPRPGHAVGTAICYEDADMSCCGP